MYDRFRDLGIPVILTRDDDSTLSRNERINTMRSLGIGADVLVLSNHINAGGGEGAEVVYPLRTSSTLPKMILDEIGAKGQIKRKIYQRVLPENPSKDYYYIMRETPNTTALLIEYGFIDNPNDRVKLQNNLLDYVEGVVKAVAEYAEVPYIAPGESEEGDFYTVKFGDTLYSLAQKFNTTVDDIKTLNGLTSSNLSIGQRLRIPTKEVEEEFINYTVKLGDTLYTIAQNYGLSVGDIIEYNNLGTTVIVPNQVLKLPTNVQSDNENIYIVKAGDTLYSIAKATGTTVNEIKLLNNLTNNNLSIGQQLQIPTTTVEEIDYVVYQVKPNDTLYSIARVYNTTVNAIKAYNNLTSDLLTIGQTLQIPISEVTTEYQNYQIARGDTLYSIARRYNTTVDVIKDYNNLTNNTLQIGQIIRIPY